MPADGRQRHAVRTIERLRCGIENVSEASDRQACLLKVLPRSRQPQHRLADAPCQQIKCDELADCQVTVDDEARAKIQNACRYQLAHELDGLACRIAETYDAKTRCNVAG